MASSAEVSSEASQRGQESPSRMPHQLPDRRASVSCAPCALPWLHAPAQTEHLNNFSFMVRARKGGGELESEAPEIPKATKAPCISGKLNDLNPPPPGG